VHTVGQLLRLTPETFIKTSLKKIKSLFKIVKQYRAPYTETHACSYYRKVQNILYLTTLQPDGLDIRLKSTEGTHNCFLWPKFCYFTFLWGTCSSQTHWTQFFLSLTRIVLQEYRSVTLYVGLYCLPFFGAFPKLRKRAISFVIFVCFFVPSHGPSCLPLDGLSLNMIFGYF
jgi:hypothetical protein